MTEISICKGPYLGDDKLYVRLDDYAELKAQLSALSVECAQYKSLAERFAERADDYKSEHFGYSVFDSSNEFKQHIKTPATDAYLNSVRAEGVDKAIAHLHKKFEGTGHIGVPVMALAMLATQLRTGKDGQ